MFLSRNKKKYVDTPSYLELCFIMITIFMLNTQADMADQSVQTQIKLQCDQTALFTIAFLFLWSACIAGYSLLVLQVIVSLYGRL